VVNDTIEYCSIGDGITTPTNAIYSAGTLWGQIIVILRFQIIIFYNYFSATVSSNGIL
jgi:hypothetical protein